MTTQMLATAGVQRDAKVLDLQSRLRCRECDARRASRRVDQVGADNLSFRAASSYIGVTPSALSRTDAVPPIARTAKTPVIAASA
jgi:hypothetical protein